VTPDRGRRKPEPAAERSGSGRPEFQDQPGHLSPGGGGAYRLDVFHNIIVP